MAACSYWIETMAPFYSTMDSTETPRYLIFESDSCKLLLLPSASRKWRNNISLSCISSAKEDQAYLVNYSFIWLH